MGASRGVSSHVDKGNCSSSDGKEVNSGGTGEGDSGGTDAGDIPCVTWRLWMGALNNKLRRARAEKLRGDWDTITEGGTA